MRKAGINEVRVDAFIQQQTLKAWMSVQQCLSDLFDHVEIGSRYRPQCRDGLGLFPQRSLGWICSAELIEVDLDIVYAKPLELGVTGSSSTCRVEGGDQ